MPAITTNLDNWNTDENYVAQAMESCMYASAHADDTLVLVGPARKPADFNDLKAVGVLQNFSVQQGRSIVPHQAIGSARTFFQSSKTSVSGSIGRLFVNGQNLHRALYNNLFDASGNYLLAGATPDKSSLLPHDSGSRNTNYLANLDSRMFLIPFGMAVIFRDKLQNEIGGIYIELMVIPNWSANVSAGSPTLVEGTSFLADRVLAISSGKQPTKAPTANQAFNEQLAGAGNMDGLAARLNAIIG